MTATMTDFDKNQYGTGANFSCEKTRAYVTTSFYDGRVTVLVNNASHRFWRGPGKFFSSFDEAISTYRSGTMKAIIELAQKELMTTP